MNFTLGMNEGSYLLKVELSSVWVVLLGSLGGQDYPSLGTRSNILKYYHGETYAMRVVGTSIGSDTGFPLEDFLVYGLRPPVYLQLVVENLPRSKVRYLNYLRYPSWAMLVVHTSDSRYNFSLPPYDTWRSLLLRLVCELLLHQPKGNGDV